MGIWYFTYLKIYREEDLEAEGYTLPSWIEMSHVLVIIVIRAVVIAAKYSLHSDENYYLRT